MGIKFLMKFIKQNYRECIYEKDISELSGKIIAIDTPCLMYKYKYTINNHGNNWVNYLLFFILNCIKNNIDTVFVLEGKAPKEKDITKAKRSKVKENIVKRREYLTKLFEQYKEDGNLTSELLDEWKKMEDNNPFSEKVFEKNLKKIQLYSECVSKEDYNLFYKILEAFNINVYQSLSEAETTCAYLYKKNKVSFIYSHDSDVLAYVPTNGFIVDIDFKKNKFEFVDKKKLLELMSFSETQFMDFCILCGTDYNKTVPKIGIKTSFRLISEKLSIDNLNFSEEHLEQLKVSWIRDKFNLKEFSDFVFEDFIIKWPFCNLEKINDIISCYGIVLYFHVKNMLSKIEHF